MLWLTALLLVSLAHLSVGAKVFTQRLTPVTTPRIDSILRQLALEESRENGANVTIEHQQRAYEFYLVDITVGTPRMLSCSLAGASPLPRPLSPPEKCGDLLKTF